MLTSNKTIEIPGDQIHILFQNGLFYDMVSHSSQAKKFNVPKDIYFITR
jgi:hypothetical protein